MTSTQYRKALEKLGLSQMAAARVLGVNGRTSQRWASGEQDIPKLVEIALTLMIENDVDPGRFQEK